MNTKRGDMPAMAGGHKVMKRINPSDPGSNYAQMAYSEPKYKGMTIREQFAMAAMQGLIAAKPDMGYSEAAHQAKAHADALLFELERTK